MQREGVERLARLLDALSGDCAHTDGWEDGGATCTEAAAALRALMAERDAALKEQERLARAWEAKHDAMVQQAKDHEDYFDKTQRRMAELVAERDAAFAAGQEEMRRRAVAATVSVETDHPSWVNAGSWACASELCGIRINDLPIKPRP